MDRFTLDEDRAQEWIGHALRHGRDECDAEAGAGAALAVLREAVQEANGLLDDLDNYIAARAA